MIGFLSNAMLSLGNLIHCFLSGFFISVSCGFSIVETICGGIEVVIQFLVASDPDKGYENSAALLCGTYRMGVISRN